MRQLGQREQDSHDHDHLLIGNAPSPLQCWPPGQRDNLPMRLDQKLAAATLTAAALLVAVSPVAYAGAFTVVPVRLYFGPRDRAVAVTLTNTGSSPIALQAELYSWTQTEKGNDVLTATEDLILAPPLIRLLPGTRQVVRLALLRGMDPQRQLSYRMIVRELPDLQATQRDTVSVPVTLALNLPVFVTPPVAHSDIVCVTERLADVVQAVCENRGNAYALLREVVLRRDGNELARFEGGAYVLPGVRRRVPLDAKGRIEPGPAQLFLNFDGDQQVQANELVP